MRISEPRNAWIGNIVTRMIAGHHSKLAPPYGLVWQASFSIVQLFPAQQILCNRQPPGRKPRPEPVEGGGRQKSIDKINGAIRHRVAHQSASFPTTALAEFVAYMLPEAGGGAKGIGGPSMKLLCSSPPAARPPS